MGESAQREVNVASLRAKLHNCASRGRLDEATAVMRAIAQEAGGALHVEDCNTFLRACAKAQNVDVALAFLSTMEDNNLGPDERSYNIVLNALAKYGSADSVAECLTRLLEHVVPTAATFSSVCNYYARIGNADAVEGIMSAMEAMGMETNEYFYAALTTAYTVQAPQNLEKKVRDMLEVYVNKGFQLAKLRSLLQKAVGQQQATALFIEYGEYDMKLLGESGYFGAAWPHSWPLGAQDDKLVKCAS